VNNEGDSTSHPWPPTGKQVQYRWREAVWMPVRPWYEANGAQFKLEDIWFLAVFKGKFPFFTWNVKFVFRGKEYGFHGYAGWKPIPVALDPAFDWNKLPTAQKFIRQGALFVQLSCRGGINAIS
jgi:hypothetical protein